MLDNETLERLRLDKRLIRLFKLLSFVLFSVVILRLAISIFHPKVGDLISVVEYLDNSELTNWFSYYITFPTYDLLIKSIWSNRLGFFVYLVAASLLGFYLTKPIKDT
jgi:peptidoglycan/LPS O-acetylase OafA/YrhL